MKTIDDVIYFLKGGWPLGLYMDIAFFDLKRGIIDVGCKERLTSHDFVQICTKSQYFSRVKELGYRKALEITTSVVSYIIASQVGVYPSEVNPEYETIMGILKDEN